MDNDLRHNAKTQRSKDAKEFFKNGKESLAVLRVSFAGFTLSVVEGLRTSLRIQATFSMIKLLGGERRRGRGRVSE
jgi:hypothetical protein